MTLNEQYTQMMFTGVIEIILGVAIMAVAIWFLWRRYFKNKPNRKSDGVNPEDVNQEDEKKI
jgi:hypothetical protein